jgi:hypothetical protein
MAGLQTIPGLTGFQYARVSSLDERAIGKLTDTNHLFSLQHSGEPAMYDKKIIDIYTQSSLYSNDFLTMLSGSTPYYIKGNTDAWQWDIEVPYKFPKIVALPTATQNLAKPGIDGTDFEIVMDSGEFFEKQVITAHKMYGQQLLITKDPSPCDGGFLYRVTLISNNPLVEFADKSLIQPGIEYSLVNMSVGEFDQTLPGLGRMGDRITMFDSIGGAVGYEHTITSWADAQTLRDSKGNPLDLLVYINNRRNEKPITRNDIRWEPYVEFLMRKQLMELKVQKMIWAKPGTARSFGSSQELKKLSAGVYYRMRNNGNLVQFNAGGFSTNIFRNVFGDLFYRRVDVAARKVRIYTNEAGFDLFDQALKDDALNSGLTIIADERFIQGSQQKLTLNYAFSSMVTRETGEITLIHLKELDLPQSNLEFGQNKKSTPLFLVFDVSPSGDGTLKNNLREVRQEGQPSMTWGYVDGRRSHLGFAASQGMNSGSMNPGYTLWMEDRYDLFIEDLSRCVVIEQIPQF